VNDFCGKCKPERAEPKSQGRLAESKSHLELLLRTENEAHESLESLLRSENEALRRSVSLLEERLLDVNTWSQKHPCPEEKDAKEEKDANVEHERVHNELRETMRCENDELKRERKSMQERLEIFERALALESPKHGEINLGDDCKGDETGTNKTKLGDKLEKLHSQFVLEVVGLRKEVSGLKKKKWVLRSVLASGGETERQAIESEVMELRKSHDEGTLRKALKKEKAAINGSWASIDDNKVNVINGSNLTWNDGEVTRIRVKNPSSFDMELRGSTCAAELRGDGKLHWNDGDVWIRCEASDINT